MVSIAGEHSLKRISRDYLVALSGRGTSAFLLFLVSIVLARAMSQENFGSFYAFLAFVGLFAALMDLGISQTFVRFGSLHHHRNEKDQLADMLHAALKAKITLGIAIGTIGLAILALFPIGSQLSNPSLLLLVPIGGFAMSFFYMIQGVLQVQLQFKNVSFLLVSRGMMFLAAVAGLVLLSVADAISVSLLFILTTAAAVLFFSGNMARLSHGGSAPGGGGRKVAHLVRFGKWLAISTTCFGIFEQLPIAASSGLYGSLNTAELSAAIVLVGTLAIFAWPLQTIVMPDLSRIASRENLRDYLRTAYRLVLPLALVILVSFIIISEMVVTTLYGDNFERSATILQILLPSFVISLIAIPLTSTIVYVFNKPAIVAGTNLAQLTILVCAIVAMTGFGNVITLAAVYAVVRAGGDIAMCFVAATHMTKWPIGEARPGRLEDAKD